MLGVFLKRVSINQWLFCTEDGIQHKLFGFPDTPPLLKSVKYLIFQQAQKIFLKNGEKEPWSLKIHEVYFPGTKFTNTPPCPSKVPKNHPYRRYYDFETWFHFQKLIPSRNVAYYSSLIEEKQWKELVYQFGNVDPLVLRRFIGDVELIRDANLLKIITNLVKETKTIWLDSEHCQVFLEDDSYQDAYSRLIDAKVLVLKDGKIALEWMTLESKTETKLDTSVLAIDPWMDKMQLPEFSISTYAPKTSIRQFQNYPILMAEMSRIAKGTCVTFSRNGKYSFGEDTFLFRGELSLIKPSKGETCLVDGKSVSNFQIFAEDPKWVNCQSFSDLPEFQNLGASTFIFILEHEDDKRWISWFELLKGNLFISKLNH